MGFRVPALSRVNPRLQRPAPNRRCVPTPNQCRSGFTREYGSGGNGGLPEDIGQHRHAHK
ncbi:hypothetical protein CBP05_24815 [Pseudomonas putida]|nr:hypothetical protein CBP05_24815 [Pseudomonas putida]OUS82957.1 hypothetical protein CBP06_24415 [Pseudomonas putida]